MTNEEAQTLIEQIRREEGERVRVQLTQTTNRGIRFTALHLLLVPGQRIMRITSVDEWESVKHVWSLF